MTQLASFFEQNLILGFFLYGLAFFTMGLAVWLESTRSSRFHDTQALLFLAGFGLLHGIHEWVDVATRLPNASIINFLPPEYLSILRIGLLVTSFSLLCAFGFRLIYANISSRDDGSPGNGRRRTIISVSFLLCLWLAGAFIIWLQNRHCHQECLFAIDALSRYTLSLPGAFLTAWALLLEHRRFKVRGMGTISRDMRWAGYAFAFYGFPGQVFPHASFLFPSNIINGDFFQQVTNLPVELFRTLAAIAISVFVTRALRAFEIERQQRLAAANEARLATKRAALATEERARRESEQLNRELTAAVQDLTMLFELSRSLGTTLDSRQLIQMAMAQIYERVPRISGGMILWREKQERPLHIMAEAGYQGQNNGTKNEKAAEQAQAVGEYAVQAGAPACWSGDAILSLAAISEASEHIAAQTGLFTIGIPLTLQEQVFGSIVLSVIPRVIPISQRDLSLMETMTSQLSVALENARLYGELQDREAVRSELLHQVVSAQETERQRIARELHDEVGQRMTALNLGLAAASEWVKSDPERGAAQLVDLKTMGADVMDELHHLVSGLRPSVLDTLGLAPALRSLAQEFEARTAVSTKLTINGRVRRVRPEVETVVFRIIQEALTNVGKHAAAQTVNINLDFTNDNLTLRVRDDGRGFNVEKALGDALPKRWGVLGMEERVSLVNGSFTIESTPGDGTLVQATIPLNDTPEETGQKEVAEPIP
ncbi:MAG: histidine kinase [Anaerolineae bacterium]